MPRLNKAYLLFSVALFLVLIGTVYSTEQVIVKFLYWDVSKETDCLPCWQDVYDQFLEKNSTVNWIQRLYGNQVLVEWIEFKSSEGKEERMHYNVTMPNSLVIVGDGDNFTRITSTNFNTTYIRQVINAYLAGSEPPPPPPPTPLIAVLATAFTFGFFETFSPCLIALLSFILSYTIGEATRFKQSLLQVMTFGTGFVSSALLLGLTVGMLFISFASYYRTLFLVACVFAILFGINLLGLNFLKRLNVKVETKPLVRELSRKYAFTYAGLLMLGFVFYFLDPCLVPFFVSTVPVFLSEYLVLILLVFSLGVITPFVGIGLLAGSISKLARSTYRHKSKIRALSGAILIAYSLYLIIFYVL